MAIEKRKDTGEWRVRWRELATGVIRSRGCPTLRAARELDREIKEAHALGREWQPAPTGGEPTIAAVAEAYQDARKIRLRQRTVEVEGMHLDLFLRFLGEKFPRAPATMGILSRQLLDEFLGWLLRPETSRHGKKARAMESAIKSVRAAQLLWKWAEDSERWQGIPRARTVELPRTIPADVVAPTWAEMDACVLECRGWQKQLATWLRYTGLRAGESMLLLWSDVDLLRGAVTIRAELDKNKRGRTVPLSPFILDEIATWGVREGYLIPTKRHKDAKHHRDPRARDLRRAWIRAGVREAVWTQRPEHAFRRGFKSGLLALGCNADAVDYLQGHSLGEGSRGRYIDAWSLPLAETVAKVPRIGSGNVARLGVVRTDPGGAA